MTSTAYDAHTLSLNEDSNNTIPDEVVTEGEPPKVNGETPSPMPANGGSSENPVDPTPSPAAEAQPLEDLARDAPPKLDTESESPPGPAEGRLEEVKNCFKRIESIEDQIRIRSEAGDFDETEYQKIDELVESLEDARRELNDGNLVVAISKVMRTELQSHQILSVRGFRRLLVVHHLPILSYFLALIAVVSILGLSNFGAQNTVVWGVPTLFIAAGTLGACFRGVWWVCRKITLRQFRVWFVAQYLLAPVIGAFLGSVVFLLINAGAINSNAASEGGHVNTIPTLLAFLAGFNWEWAMEKISGFTKSH
jgi:hypothetical protein